MTNYQLMRCLEVVARSGYADFEPYVANSCLVLSPIDMRVQSYDDMQLLMRCGLDCAQGTPWVVPLDPKVSIRHHPFPAALDWSRP